MTSPADRQFEFLLDWVDSDDKFPWEVSIVDSVIDNSIAGINKGDHADAVCLSEHVNIIFDISEIKFYKITYWLLVEYRQKNYLPVKKTPVVSSLDSGSDVEHGSDRADRNHGNTKTSGLFIDQSTKLHSTLVIQVVGVSFKKTLNSNNLFCVFTFNAF